MTANERTARYTELFSVALIIFAAVSLGTTEFIKNAMPSRDALHATKTIVVYTIIIAQVVPAFLLIALDRLIATRDASGRLLRIFRSVIFVAALLLILRQIQLYWGPAEDFANSVRSASLVLLILLDLAVLAALVGLAVWAYNGLTMFFYYMSPIAIAVSAIIPFQVDTFDDLPDTYSQEVTAAHRSESDPAVFVLIFDGLGYHALYENGILDTDSFPNIALLAQDGISFSNGTTNHFWSMDAVPMIIDPVTTLTDEFDVRLYSQYPVIERLYVKKQCGQTITCRGVGYLTENDPLRVASNLTLRSFYQAMPKPFESAISRPMGWFLDRVGWAYPSLDRPGWHTFTKRQFDTFLNDAVADEARGRISVLHLLLPHQPMVFDEDGDALSKVIKPRSEGYRRQTMFVDRLVGRLVDRMKSENIYDDSVIIITGDHGIRPYVPEAKKPPIAAITDVPLVIHAADLESHGTVSDVDYQHIDFGPTLTDVLGLPPPPKTKGVSAFDTERPEREKFFRVRNIAFVYDEENGTWEVRERGP